MELPTICQWILNCLQLMRGHPLWYPLRHFWLETIVLILAAVCAETEK